MCAVVFSPTPWTEFFLGTNTKTPQVFSDVLDKDTMEQNPSELPYILDFPKLYKLYCVIISVTVFSNTGESKAFLKSPP